MTPAQTLAAHFNSGLTISQMEATGLYRMPQLPRVIFDMKKQGWSITTEIRQTLTGRNYARYIAEKDPQGRMMPASHD